MGTQCDSNFLTSNINKKMFVQDPSSLTTPMIEEGVFLDTSLEAQVR